VIHSIILEVSVLLLFLWCLWRVCLSQSWLIAVIASPCTKRLTYQTIEKLSIVWLHPGGVVPRYPQVSWRTWPIGFRKNPVGPMGYHSVYSFGSNMEQFLGTEHQKPLSNKPTCNMFGHVPCYIWPYPSVSPSIQIIWAKSPVHPVFHIPCSNPPIIPQSICPYNNGRIPTKRAQISRQ
jgi:hypothetical protein